MTGRVDPLRAIAREQNSRIALALSILQQRHFCPGCRKDADDARLALLGATIDELREGIAGGAR